MSRGVYAVLTLAILACGSDTTAPPTREEVAGTYTLRLVNGQPLPFESVQRETRVLSSELHLTDFASAAYMLFRTEPLDSSDSPSEWMQQVGWGLTTGDSLIVNILFTFSTEPHPGILRGDTVKITATADQSIPVGAYYYVREGQ